MLCAPGPVARLRKQRISHQLIRNETARAHDRLRVGVVFQHGGHGDGAAEAADAANEAEVGALAAAGRAVEPDDFSRHDEALKKT